MFSLGESYVFTLSKLCFYLVNPMFLLDENVVFTVSIHDFSCQKPAFPTLDADSQRLTLKFPTLIPTLKLHWKLQCRKSVTFSVGNFTLTYWYSTSSVGNAGYLLFLLRGYIPSESEKVCSAIFFHFSFGCFKRWRGTGTRHAEIHDQCLSSAANTCLSRNHHLYPQWQQSSDSWRLSWRLHTFTRVLRWDL